MPRNNHPIWGLAQSVVTLGGLAFVLWLNASNFDETEIRAIAMWLPFLFGSKAIRNWGGDS